MTAHACFSSKRRKRAKGKKERGIKMVIRNSCRFRFFHSLSLLRFGFLFLFLSLSLFHPARPSSAARLGADGHLPSPSCCCCCEESLAPVAAAPAAAAAVAAAAAAEEEEEEETPPPLPPPLPPSHDADALCELTSASRGTNLARPSSVPGSASTCNPGPRARTVAILPPAVSQKSSL